MKHPSRVERSCYRCANSIIIMYRTASYLKNVCLERLEVNVFEDLTCRRMVLQIHVDFEFQMLHAKTIIPRSYQGHSLSVQFDELRRLNNFLDVRGWRDKCASYHDLVRDKL